VTPDELLAAAREGTGLDDFGDDELFGGDGWRVGLARLLDSIAAEARFSELGQLAAQFEMISYLSNRLRIVDHHRRHPEIRDRDIVPPLVIMGQARTGTTMLFDTLARDPDHRAPLSWEVEQPLPPPRTETYWTDPRIDEAETLISVIDTVVPGFRTIHQLGGRLGQEDGRILGSAFVSTIYANQYRVPGYLDWYLHDAVRDGYVAAAYRWHRRFLEVLQSEHRCARWLVKWPSHVWTLPQLMAEYPDALLVQTHRDPAKVLASNTSMLGALRRLYSDDVDVAEIGPEYAELILDGFERTVDARLDGTVPASQVVDLQFATLMADPLGSIRGIYDRFGLRLSPAAEARMAAFLRDNARASSGHSYSFDIASVALEEVRSRTARYSEYFRVPQEEF
jgi:hypothetical protein